MVGNRATADRLDDGKPGPCKTYQVDPVSYCSRRKVQSCSARRLSRWTVVLYDQMDRILRSLLVSDNM